MEPSTQVVDRALGRVGLPLRGNLLLLGCLCDPGRVPLTYRGLAGLHPSCTFGVPVVGLYPSYHPLVRELRLRAERVSGLP